METIREKLKNLLIILLETIASGGGAVTLDRQQFQERVAAAGYDETDINGLLDWLEDQGIPGSFEDGADAAGVEVSTGSGIRFFGEEERQFLTPSAFGYLLNLCHSSQITRQQMESLIHYASLVSVAPLEREDMEQLLDHVIYGSCGRGLFSFPFDRPGNAH